MSATPQSENSDFECGNQCLLGTKESWRLIAQWELQNSAPQTLFIRGMTSSSTHSVKQQTANWNQHASS